MHMTRIILTATLIGWLCLLMPTFTAVAAEQEPVAHIDTVAARRTLMLSQTAELTDQIILVEGHTLSLWQCDDGGRWTMALMAPCGLGRRGMSLNRKEGDKTTPIGSFSIITAFGIASDPGAAMPYRRVTRNSYWSGEPRDYNTWVEVKPGTRRMPNSEHLIRYTVPYQYAMAIGFNIDPVVQGRGSAIFLHCKSVDSWSTAGCVSVQQSVMVELLRQCRATTRIIIVPTLAYIDMLGL